MENRKFLKISVVALFILALALLIASDCSANQWILFYDEEIKGSVIDAETQKPIEGVIVVGMWRLSQFLSQGFGGYAKIILVKTDSEGKFVIPSWTTFKPLTFDSSMHDLAPEIVIYKPGYKVYYSHRVEREGFPDHYEMTKEEKELAKNKYSINPTRLVRIYTDEERLENYDDWGTIARFPDKHFSKEQSRIIFDALEEELMQVSDKNERKTRLLITNKKLREFWGEGDKK